MEKGVKKMKYKITAACGHEVYVQLFGPTKQREYKIKQLESEYCLQCRLDTAQKRDKSFNLPPLKGTPRQILWASTIRWKLVCYWKRLRYNKNCEADKIIEIVNNHTECTWWIDNRLNIDRIIG